MDTSDIQIMPSAVANDAALLIKAVLDGVSLRAGSFIVTLYGDVVEPRGGRLWMGNIIETCASVGISETLVRTAVSRLVAAGQLEGEREGRRSFYRLTERAQRQFLEASRTLFEPEVHHGWSFVWVPPEGEAEATALEQSGFARLNPQWLLGPTPHMPITAPLVVFEASANHSQQSLQRLARAHWALEEHEAAYADVVARFAPVKAALDAGNRFTAAQALQLRLVLVHLFRQTALRDPQLPPEALPEDWAGQRARALFGALYVALSALADLYVAQNFVSLDGQLPEVTATTRHRLAMLQTA